MARWEWIQYTPACVCVCVRRREEGKGAFLDDETAVDGASRRATPKRLSVGRCASSFSARPGPPHVAEPTGPDTSSPSPPTYD